MTLQDHIAQFVSVFRNPDPAEPRSLELLHTGAVRLARLLSEGVGVDFEIDEIRKITISTATPQEDEVDFEVPGFLVSCSDGGESASLVVLGEGVFIEERR